VAESERGKIIELRESGAKEADLAPLVGAHGARIGNLEGECAALRAQLRAVAFEVDAGLAAAKSRLGQVRNVESRSKALLEQMRALHADVLRQLHR